MKIILACTTIETGHRDETSPDSHYPLGLAYIQAYLEKYRKGKDEFVNMFLNNVDFDTCKSKLVKQFNEFKPDIVGLSIMTHSRVSAFKIIEYLHEHHPDVKIVVGGMHVSVLYKQLVEHYPYVVAVRGEGERTMNTLVNTWEDDISGAGLKDIPGIAFHDGKEVVKTQQAELIPNLDDLPFPKHDLFMFPGKRMAGLLTSRGCPFKCNFCVLDALSRRNVRFRSGENIADEVEMILKNNPSVTTVWIHDDAFMISRDRTLDFCDAIIRRGIKTQFIASARFRPINKEVVFKMKEAGFVQVLFGLESGAEEVLKGIKKGITKNDVRYGMKLFSQVGIKATAFLIVGLPGESDETVKETVDFIQEIQKINYLFYDDIGVAMIYPGTTIYDQCKASGHITDDYWLTDGSVPYYTTEFGGDNTLEKLETWKAEVREGIALEHMFISSEGFLQQRKLLPEIVRYAVRFPRLPGIEKLILLARNKHWAQTTKNGTPLDDPVSVINDLVLNDLFFTFLLGDTDGLRNTFCRVIEDIIVELHEERMSIKERLEFATSLVAQRIYDEAKLKEFSFRSKDIVVEEWDPAKDKDHNSFTATLPRISSAGGVSMDAGTAAALVEESGQQF